VNSLTCSFTATSEASFKWIPKWPRMLLRARLPLHEAFTKLYNLQRGIYPRHCFKKINAREAASVNIAR